LLIRRVQLLQSLSKGQEINLPFDSLHGKNTAKTKEHIMAKAQFVPTRTIRFQKGNFQTVLSMEFPSDGWHLIPLDYLIQGEGDSQVDEGGELVSFVVEAAGENEIDYDALLKCRVIDGVVDAIYTPGVMGADGQLYLVSGDNRFLIEYDTDSQRFLVGNLKGRLTEREYKRADESTGKAVSILFTPNNSDLKVVYDIPFVLKKWEDISHKLPEGAIVSLELFEWILQEQGAELLANILLQTLGEGEWKLIDWVKRESQKPKDGEKPLPPNYQLFLTKMNGEPLPDTYFSNKAVSDQLNAMSKVFRSYLAQGRELKLKITEIYKVGQYDAAKCAIQFLPPTTAAVGMKSAAVADLQLSPQKILPAQTAAEFMQRMNPVDTEAVEVKATPIAAVDEKGEGYDPIPF
jgi:hypothetical protein